MSTLPLIIEPQQLADHLDDAQLLILDLSSTENYANAHIPGAIHVDPQQLLRGKGPVPNKLPTAGQLSALLSGIGLSPERHVVVYDDQKGPWAGRMIWTLAIAGHHNASFLNGQLPAWLEAGLPTEQCANAPTPTQYNVEPDTGLVVDIPWLLNHLNTPTVKIWDARSLEEYRGEKVINAKWGGHIPGAHLLEWTDLLEPGPIPRLRDRETVRLLMSAAGLDGADTLVTHCQTHRRSGLTWLVGRWLGVDDIRCYDGSWFEWGNTPDLPIER
ncbi:Thiosulfate sulfurtransferase, rhodanese [Marinobacterium lacunae]|uniref:Thiosulfate sulfurtransferase, rhodanese n=1 Tax=Marinobacterium lacunae TaxID=1232683 RepID=A0A081G236_9GAMM|nr:sulfurtransferase [Marinobacterium lacunae]KEA64841.1 Thiosulfate sulfurtransferase, rhodanese [Marinobacterium lacunae]